MRNLLTITVILSSIILIGSIIILVIQPTPVNPWAIAELAIFLLIILKLASFRDKE